MKIRIPCYVDILIRQLNQHGFEAYLVGGCVRDSLLGQDPKDYDIATSARPEEVKLAITGCRLLDTGLAHGTVTALSEDNPVEITTFRIDGSYSDHRHPDGVIFSSTLREDLKRRDFTVNAMAYHPETGLMDYFGGREDLFLGLLRCVGDPDTRFQEDALRIFRALRFSSQLGFLIEEQTGRSILKNRALLHQVAAERVSAELVKLLCGKNAENVLTFYREVFAEMIPELVPLFGFNQHSPYHAYDAYIHTVKAVAAVSPEPVLRLAMLLHDISKPELFSLDKNGRGHFPGHSRAGAEKAGVILNRLRMSRETVSTVTALVLHHEEKIAPEPACIKKWMNRLSPKLLRKLLLVQIADNSAKGPDFPKRKDQAEKALAISEQILAENQCYCLKQLAVNGTDLVNVGIVNGKKIGEILNILLEKVITESLLNEKAALLEEAKRL